MEKTVYIILHTLSVGGAERHASSIANYLFQHGYKVKIVLLDNNIVDYTLMDGVDVIALSDSKCQNSTKFTKISFMNKVRLKIYRMISAKKYSFLDKKLYLESFYIKKLEYFLRQQKSIAESIVISFMPIPNISAAALKRKFNYKLILGEFNSPQLEFAVDAPENILKRKFFSNADGFVFQTSEQEEFYSYLKNIKKIIIPNPIEDIHTMPYHGKRRKEIVNYCRHVKAKNLPLLIEAYAKLVQEYPDYKLVIYGDGPEKANIEKCIEKHGLADKVQLRAYAKNVLDLVKESAMFVSSSDREGISNSMIEAMAIGLPTICTDCPAGGARMMIKPYMNGLLVPVKDVEALYGAMKYIIDNPEKAEIMSKNAVEIRNTLKKSKILEQWSNFVSNI